MRLFIIFFSLFLFHQDLSAEEVYYCWLENLRVRDKPGLKSKVVGHINAGDIVYYLNEETPYKTKIEIDYIPFNRPWLKKGLIGWVFGAGLVQANSSIYNKQIPKGIKTGENRGKFYPIGWSSNGYFAYAYEHQEVACAEDYNVYVTFYILDVKNNNVLFMDFITLGYRFDYGWYESNLDLFKQKMKQYKIKAMNTKYFNFSIVNGKTKWKVMTKDDSDEIKIFIKSGKNKQLISKIPKRFKARNYSKSTYLDKILENLMIFKYIISPNKKYFILIFNCNGFASDEIFLLSLPIKKLK